MTASLSTQAQESKKILRHVVMFKFTDNTTAETMKKAEASFVALAGKIELIRDFEWGKNSSPENLNQGLTHCFLVTFSSDHDRDKYLIHPDHTAFVALVGPLLDKVIVVDYWTGK